MNCTMSPSNLPISARAIGEETLIMLRLMSAFVVAHDLVRDRRVVFFVVERDGRAEHDAVAASIVFGSITCSAGIFPSSSAMRPSMWLCSSRAASYSAFSERSPFSRASAMAATTCGRAVFLRYSSSA